jgi:predicted RNase H-like HicB family nuclease
MIPCVSGFVKIGIKLALCYNGWVRCSRRRRIIMRVKVVLEPSEDGGFTVYVPSLPGCISEGDNEKEAITNIEEAIELYLETVEGD